MLASIACACAFALAAGIAPATAFADGDDASGSDNVYGLKVTYPNGDLSSEETFVTSDNFFNQSYRATLEENGIPTHVWNVETKTGDTRTRSDGQTAYLFDITLQYFGSSENIDLDSMPDASAKSRFVRSSDDPAGQYYMEVRLTWNPEPWNGKWDPFAPRTSSTSIYGEKLLPYVMGDKVITFPDYPQLGRWNQLDANLGEGIVFDGIIFGGGDDRVVTILRSDLNDDDALYTEDNAAFPLWLREDHGENNYTFMQFSATGLSATDGFDYYLEPANAGTINSYGFFYGDEGEVTGVNVNVQLDAPATIVVKPSTGKMSLYSDNGVKVVAPHLQ